VYSVAVAPDGDRFGFVLRDDDGDPTNTISVINTADDTADTYELRAPALDGASLNTIAFADVMDFTANSGFLVYDALNLLRLDDGSRVEAYSIYALDLATGESQIVIPPSPPLDVANPSLGQRSDDLLAFEVLDFALGTSTVVAGDLLTGDLSAIA
jgi:hypothetical protein